MTRTGLGRGMALIAVGEGDAAGEASDAAAQAIPIMREQVRGKLIDDDGDDQFGTGGRNRRGGGQQGGAQQHEPMPDRYAISAVTHFGSAMTVQHVGMMTGLAASPPCPGPDSRSAPEPLAGHQ